MTGSPGLTENDIVEAVCRRLVADGWQINTRASTRERGPDIVAEGPGGGRLVVEAKGATSARQGSARFGKPFDGSQARVHVAEAFFTAAVASVAGARGNQRGALALPDDQLHRRLFGPARLACERLNLGVFWVASDSEVRLDAPWTL
jgi:hypothetical protein